MNHLTPKQLEMINRLQPFFKEKMGEWEQGDLFISVSIKPNLVHIYNIDLLNISCDISHIPKVYDWQNPERGLWEMLLGVKVLSQDVLGCSLLVTTEHHQRKYYDNHYSILAILLKALCEQEGV